MHGHLNFKLSNYYVYAGEWNDLLSFVYLTDVKEWYILI